MASYDIKKEAEMAETKEKMERWRVGDGERRERIGRGKERLGDKSLGNLSLSDDGTNLDDSKLEHMEIPKKKGLAKLARCLVQVTLGDLEESDSAGSAEENETEIRLKDGQGDEKREREEDDLARWGLHGAFDHSKAKYFANSQQRDGKEAPEEEEELDAKYRCMGIVDGEEIHCMTTNELIAAERAMREAQRNGADESKGLAHTVEKKGDGGVVEIVEEEIDFNELKESFKRIYDENRALRHDIETLIEDQKIPNSNEVQKAIGV